MMTSTTRTIPADLVDTLVAKGLLSESKLCRSELTRAATKICKEPLPIVLASLRRMGVVATWGDHRKDVLYRRTDEQIGAVVVHPYAAPYGDPYEPLVVRWHVDHMLTYVPVRAWRELGIGEDPWGRIVDPAKSRAGKLELSCMPSELRDLAWWIPKWIYARETGTSHPPPPVEMSVPGPVSSYAWTRAAGQAIDAWHALVRGRNVYRASERLGRVLPVGVA